MWGPGAGVLWSLGRDGGSDSTHPDRKVLRDGPQRVDGLLEFGSTGQYRIVKGPRGSVLGVGETWRRRASLSVVVYP